MAYTINRTDGSVFATISDGTINTDSSMVLVGKNYAGYGEFLDENFLHLLENGANTSAPGTPQTGQLWWDSTNNVLKVYNGSLFKSVSGAIASASTPTSNVAGDLWWDTTNNQLKTYDAGTSAFVTIGPAFTSGTGTSGAIVDTITDDGATDHVVVKVFVNNTIVGIWSKDATFTPAAAISGFATIGPGLNMSTAVSNAIFNGTANNATYLNSIADTQFLRSDQNDTTSGTLGILNDSGLTVGADSDTRIFVTGTDAYYRNQTLDGDIYIQVNKGGSTNTAIQIDGATSTTGVVGITNLNAAGGIGNIGTSSKPFDTVHATATTAQYADLAERFAADAVYEAGTVVQLGGVKEITKAEDELTDSVFGVISTRAAFTMNNSVGGDETHPAVAMTGRVPVLVTGVIHKGDRLVSAGNGYARAGMPEELTAWNIIGRALEDKLTDGYGTVEAIVKVN